MSYTSAQQYSEKEIPQPEETITQQQIDQYNKNVSNTIPIDGVTVDAFVKSGKTAVIYVGFAECPHCEKFAPVLNKFINDTGVPVYYLNMDNLGQINSDFIGDMQNFQINATPTVFLCILKFIFYSINCISGNAYLISNLFDGDWLSICFSSKHFNNSIIN